MNKDGFDEFLCPNCSLSFIFPQPSAEWLKEKVYSYESGYQGNKKADLSLATEDIRFTRTLEILKQSKQGGEILDVGCSSGQFMFSAKKRGFSCSGVEINKRTADIAIANGFPVHVGFLESAQFPKRSFDVVYLGDVIEHVNDPRSFVETALSFLKPDGIIVFSTPNMGCFWSGATLALYRAFGIPWAPATPPHHLFQFSFDNLSKLLEEKGFKSTGAFYTGPKSLKYELGSLHLYKSYKKERTVSVFLFMVFGFGAYTALYGLNILLGFILGKDFQMIAYYKQIESK